MKTLFVPFIALAMLFTGVATASAADAPDVYVQKLVKEAAAGNGAALWNALPEDYQGDIEDPVEGFGNNMDAELWNKGFKLVGKLAKVMKEKKEFVLGAEVAKLVPGPQKDELTKNWDAIADALATAASSDISTLDGVKDLDIGEFFEKSGGKFVGGLIKASENNPQVSEGIKKLKSVKVSLVSKEDDEAVLKFEAEGEEPKEEKYTLVSGKWLPTEMVDGWDDAMEKAKAQLGALKIPAEQKVQVITVMSAVDGVLDQLLTAKDQETFNAQLGGLMSLFGGGAR